MRYYIVELEPGVWLQTLWSGDPGRTTVESSARRFPSKQRAGAGLWLARKYKRFGNAKIVEVDS